MVEELTADDAAGKAGGELLADLAVVAGGDVAEPYYAEAFAPMEVGASAWSRDRERVDQ